MLEEIQETGRMIKPKQQAILNEDGPPREVQWLKPASNARAEFVGKRTYDPWLGN